MTVSQITERIRRAYFDDLASGDVAEDRTLPESCRVLAETMVKRALQVGVPIERLTMVRTAEELDELSIELEVLEAGA